MSAKGTALFVSRVAFAYFLAGILSAGATAGNAPPQESSQSGAAAAAGSGSWESLAPMSEWEDFDPKLSNRPEWSTHNLAEDANLNNSVANGVAFDQQGNAWISSTSGLRMFDGYSWFAFGVKDGFTTQFLRCVTVASDGNVWVGSDQGMFLITVTSSNNGATKTLQIQKRITVDNGLAGPSVRKVAEGPPGVLWFCCDRWPDPLSPAGLTRYDVKTGALTNYRREDGLPDNHIYSFFHTSRGEDFVMTSKGVAQRIGRDGDGDGKATWRSPLAEAGLEGANNPCWSMTESSRYGLVLSTIGGFFHRPANSSTWIKRNFPDKSVVINQYASTADGGIIAARVYFEEPEYHFFDGTTFQPVSKDRLNIFAAGNWNEDLREAPDGSIWSLGSAELIRWQRKGGEWSEYHELPWPSFTDRRQRTWFIGSERAIVRMPAASGPDPINGRGQFRSVPDLRGEAHPGPEETLWQWDKSELRLLDLNRDRRMRWNLADLGCAKIRRVVTDPAGRAWLWGESAGFPADKTPRPQILQLPDIPLLLHDDGKRPVNRSAVWKPVIVDRRYMAKIHQMERDNNEGVRILASDDSEIYWLTHLREDTRKSRIDRVADGLQVTASRWFSPDTESTRQLSLSSPPQLVLDRRGRCWLRSGFGVYWFEEDGGWSKIDTSGFPGQHVSAIIESGDEIWLICDGNMGGQNGYVKYQSQTGLFEPPVTTSTIAKILGKDPRNGSMVISVNNRIEITPGDRPDLTHWVSYPGREGLTRAVPDNQGNYWFSNLLDEIHHYRPDGVPPETRMSIARRSVRMGEPIEIQAYGIEKYIPKKAKRFFRYSQRLDDGEWSPFYEHPESVDTADLLVGPHVLEVRVMDEGGDIDPTPAQITVRIEPLSLQQQSWFQAAVAFTGLTLFALTAFTFRSNTQLTRARDAALAASRAKSEFLANVSHEIRTPMNAIISMTGLLRATPISNEQTEYLHTLQAGGEALLVILNDIIDYSRLKNGELTLQVRPMDLHSCIEAALEMFAPEAARKGLELGGLIELDVPRRILGDSGRLGQVLLNLVNNAVKFTDHGEVIVEVGALPNTSNSLKYTRLRIAVKDTGIGIPQELRDRLFLPFSQVDSSSTRKHGGTGLGLAICKEIVSLMNGDISVSENPGGGSVFLIHLDVETVFEPGAPSLNSSSSSSTNAMFLFNQRASDPATSVSGEFTAANAAAVGRDLSRDSDPGVLAPLANCPILIMEDNASIRLILVRMTRSFGMRPFEAATPDQARDILNTKRGLDIHIVLMDTTLPQNEDPRAFARALHAQRPDLKLIALSPACPHSNYTRAGLFTLCLMKPIGRVTLRNHLVKLQGGDDLLSPPPADVPNSLPTHATPENTAITTSTNTSPAPHANPRRKTLTPAIALESGLGARLPLRILLAEDLPVNQKIVTTMLQRLGYCVDVAANGKEAVHAAEQHLYDLILMDVQMPEMNGLEAAKRILANNPAIAKTGSASSGKSSVILKTSQSALAMTASAPHIVALTANAAESDRNDTAAAGMCKHIAKPLRVEDLVDLLKWTHNQRYPQEN